MKKIILISAMIAVVLTACNKVPISGRNQLNLVSDSEVLQSSLASYKEYMSKATKSTQTVKSEQVTRVGRKIAAATEAYLNANGMSDQTKNFAWEFNLVKDSQLNAFCMPGGKIVVYEGIMNIISSDDELAVVLGHEVAHAVAKHSNERLSNQKALQYGGAILGAITQNASQSTQSLANTVFGLGANYGVMLPFSRKHETEADNIGLVLMTMAGYNPDCALSFWQKMSVYGSNTKAEFMSTHPSDATRIANLQKQLPQVKEKYKSYLKVKY
ncbi:MAG: M48 family metallopeptidase [Muribaculaceae bacterium]|nr:M48 family metallopeptidase [Muribaculaceae bacterium]